MDRVMDGSSTLGTARLRRSGVMAIEDRAKGLTQLRTSSAIRVLVADNHVIFRQGIRALLEQTPDIEVVAEAGDGKQALEKARIIRPDVMLTDVRIPRLGVIDLATALRSEGLATRLIILSPCTEVEMVAAAIRVGAYGYLCNRLSGPELVNGRTEALGKALQLGLIALS